MEKEIKPLIAIVGPTAVGKTAFAIQLAKEFRGEIISADSRQVYRGMDIGTAKPNATERACVPHHLMDVVNPNESFSLSDYQHLAYTTIAEIHRRGGVPMLVGGTGLYVRAVIEGLAIPRVPPDLERRAELELQEGDALYTQLQSLDPVAATRIDPRNKRRVIRALEVIHATGKPISVQQTLHAPSYRVLRIGLTMSREQLYERINARVDAMIETGLVDEVRTLLDNGYTADLPAMSGLGYRQIVEYLQGTMPLGEAIRILKRDTRRFVHHQYSWFRLDDTRIRWFDATTNCYQEIRAAVAEHLSN